MKKLFLLLFVSLLSVVSCKKEPQVLESSDERLNAILTSFKEVLLSSPCGWQATVYPKTGGLYIFHMRFNGSNRVWMYSDFNAEGLNTENEGSYRLKALQQPTLIFDTYNYIHLLADPSSSVNGGPNGKGLESDFEFSFSQTLIEMLKEKSTNVDANAIKTMSLEGRQNSSKLILERITEENGCSEEYMNRLREKRSLLEGLKIRTYFNKLKIGERNFECFINTTNRTLNLSWLNEGGIIEDWNVSFATTDDGILFGKDTIVNGIDFGKTWTDIKVSEDKGTLTFKYESMEGELGEAREPLSYISRTREFAETFLYNNTGVYIDGVKDSTKFGSNPNFGTIISRNYLEQDSLHFLCYSYTNRQWRLDSFFSFDLKYTTYKNGQQLLIMKYTTRQPSRIGTSDRHFLTFLNTKSIGSPPLPAGEGTDTFYVIQPSRLKYVLVKYRDARKWMYFSEEFSTFL